MVSAQNISKVLKAAPNTTAADSLKASFDNQIKKVTTTYKIIKIRLALIMENLCRNVSICWELILKNLPMDHKSIKVKIKTTNLNGISLIGFIHSLSVQLPRPLPEAQATLPTFLWGLFSYRVYL
jgi:hypothetical protein